MDVALLSRMQFAVSTLFHFLFVPLTLGLAVLVAIIETKYVLSEDENYKKLAKFFGRLLIINFAVGVVTGIPLEFQFGTNWSRYSEYVGDIFGSLLAIEATVAFFLESTFIAVWIFGWNKIGAKAHAAVAWLVAVGGSLSAFWILAANAWMQHPVGFQFTGPGNKPQLDSFSEIVFSRFAIIEFSHTLSSAYLLSGFFMLGVSAYHLLKNPDSAPFQKSYRLGLYFALIFSLATIFTGHLSGEEVAFEQPAKLAAMESHWETIESAPMYLLVIPDEKNERNFVQAFGIPGALSLLAFFDPNAKVQGLLDFPKEGRPPVFITFLAFRSMVGLGFLFAALMLTAFVRRNKLQESRPLLWALLFAIPLPYAAIELGWILTEVGRQPWIVYGLMRTQDAVSPIVSSQVIATLIGFILLYSLLAIAFAMLIFKYAKQGIAPDAAPGSEKENDHA